MTNADFISLRRFAAVIAATVLMAGCAGSAYKRGYTAGQNGSWDEAVEQYRQAVQEHPNKPEYKIALERAMLTASQQHLDAARIAEARMQFEEALREYRRASELDPPNRMLAGKVGEIERRLRDDAEAAARSRNTLEQMRETARRAAPPPLFNLNTVLPAIRLQDTSLRTILNAIAQAAGINVQYDTSFQDRPFSVNLENVTLQDALNQVLLSNSLFFKVVNQRTIIVAQDTLQNRTKYEDQVIRTFYLNHADSGEIVQLLNQIARLGGQQVNPQIAATKSSNTITVRGTTTMVDIIERLIEANDNPRAEVVIDVQILEVNRRRAKQFGLDLGTYSIGAAFSPEIDPRGGSTTTPATPGGAATATPPATGGSLSSPPFNANSISRGISTADFYLAVPQAIVRFLATDSETKIIAKPQLRGSEGSKLSLALGEEIPVPSTTFTPIATGGANFNPLTSYNYRPVGVNVDITPRVTLDGDIIMDLIVENSARGGDVVVAGTTIPGFISRKVTTRLRLRDGESNLLAGLLSETERKSMRGFPGLLHLPVISSLFAANEREVDQTDIIMLLTPRIVRTQELTQSDLNPIYIGTQSYPAVGGTPPLIQTEPDIAPAYAAAPAPNPPAGGASVPPPGSGPIPGTTTLPQPGAPAAPPPQTPAPAGGAQIPPAAAAPPVVPPAAAATPTVQPLPAPTGGQVLLSVPGNDFRTGAGPYTVPISVTGASRLSTVSLTVTYNPAVLRVRTVQEGSFMRTGGANAEFTQQGDPNGGRIDIAILRPGDTTGVAGTGVLGALVFDAVAPGNANLTITGTATAPGGAPLQLQFMMPPAVTVR
jgi:type II secretory pathway component GspD/PulD (secretin)